MILLEPGRIIQRTIMHYSETCIISRPRIKRTPSIKRTVTELLKSISLIYFNETFIKRTPLLHAIKRTRTAKAWFRRRTFHVPSLNE